MEAMLNNLIKALGWSIFHSLWQGALIYILLFAVLMALPKLNAKLKHNLAFGSLLAMFASFCFTFYSVFEVPLTPAERVTMNTFMTQANLQELTFLTNNSFLKTETWFPLITGFYALGILIQLVLLCTGYQKLKELKRANTSLVPDEWNRAFNTILAQLKINKQVKFLLSAKVNVPLVIGYFKPVVLFPIALASQLEIKQVEAILIHELSHIRRNDYALNLIKTFIETLLFFNPFIWLAGKFIGIEREHACDDLVVKHTGTPLTYAHALLKLELLKDKQAPALSLAATGTNQYLYQRIKRITNMKTTYINAKQQLVILVLTLSTVISLAWINPSKPVTNKAKNISTISKIATEVKDISNRLVLSADTDTTKKKKKVIKSIITVTDENGNTKTYNSIKELPDSLRSVVIRNQFIGDSLVKFYSSKDWKDRITKMQLGSMELSKKLDSKEWKEQMAKIQFDAQEMKKKFESKEWKDQIAKMQLNSEEMRKKFESKEWKEEMAKVKLEAEKMRLQFESKDWKDQIAKLQLDAAKMKGKFDSQEWKDQLGKMQFSAEAFKKQFDSQEWKQKMEDLKKLQNSPEYKELKKKFDKDLEELKKQKGIKSDKVLLNLDANADVQTALSVLSSINPKSLPDGTINGAWQIGNSKIIIKPN